MVIRSKPLRILIISTAVILTVIALIALIMVFAFDSIFLTMLAKNLALLPGSPVYTNWLKPSVPIHFSINLFNVTNPEEVYAGAKPHLQVVGPFVYRETRERYNVNFSENASPRTVRFNHRIFYHFVPEKSIGDPNKYKIFTPDLYSLFIYPTALGWFANKAFISLTAQEVMWGYQVAFKTVGIFAKMNGTSVNEYVINIGTEDIQNLGKIYEVNGEEKTKVWTNSEANMINGTDGSLFPPGLQIGSTVAAYSPEICRASTLYAIDKKTTLNHDKVEVLVFTGSPPDPDDPLAKWRSNMFCESAFRGCPPKGMLALQPCLAAKESSVPLYISQPFFMGADPKIAASFDGLPVPDPYNHSTWVHIEPTTGFVLEAFKRVQFNYYMINDSPSVFGSMSKDTPHYIPIAWIEETAIADKGTLDMLYNRVLSTRKFFPFLFSIVAAVSIVLAVIMIIILVVCVRTRGTSHMSKRNGTVSPASIDAFEPPKQYTMLDAKAMSATTSPWSGGGGGDEAYPQV